MKAAGSLLAGLAAVMAALNIGDGHGLARDGLLGHMSAKDAAAGQHFGEEAAKSFEKIQPEHHGHLGDRTWWGWMSGSKKA